jgi:hypothetical protein
MVLGKQEQLDRIKKADKKIKRMSKLNQMGPELDKLVTQVIKWEELYFKRYGRDPNAQLKN